MITEWCITAVSNPAEFNSNTLTWKLDSLTQLCLTLWCLSFNEMNVVYFSSIMFFIVFLGDFIVLHFIYGMVTTKTIEYPRHVTRIVLNGEKCNA